MESNEIIQSENNTRDYNLNEDEKVMNEDMKSLKIVTDCLQLMVDHVVPAKDKTFKYNICNREFIKADHPKVHNRTNAGETQYHCDSCGFLLWFFKRCVLVIIDDILR